MKKFLRKLLPKRLIIFFSYIFNYRVKPYSIRSQIFPSLEYSDFFILMNNAEENIFIAENIYGLLAGKPINVVHIISFYSSNGKLIKSQEYEKNDLFVRLPLPRFNLEDRYISFTHSIKSKDLLSNNIDNKLKRNLISFQHRGYTLIKKSSDSLGSIVHGNVGAIKTKDFKKSSLILKNQLFNYTPVYKFEFENQYHLVFNNPTNKLLEIEVKLVNAMEDPKIYLKICPFGNGYIEIVNYIGMISFESKLAVCRCIIFKNPDFERINFDVFHS